ncbi:alginate O-acetyltransferase [Fictibacillus arsenicus]|uniref:Alginate O-acetyltransferase n=1 Tax=Fictibacillus arsenicus TaxID=255247 RepID=A0A1B1Z8U1_9BACL|nr:MBOAT family protein [Fictibacillus arsenicus]ANX13789.1 alginate O-acetyltransferase [Fictibacillus arsenicus]
MVFSNLVFLFMFLPIVLAAYFLLPRMFKNFILLLASLIFYAWGEPKYVILMLVSIVMNYIFGLMVHKFRNQIGYKKMTVALAVIANIGLLGYYKYSNFLIENMNSLFDLNIANEPLPLPIGISFFTFQAMSYVIDVYRRDAAVQSNIFDLALYIALFPQLVAGPIVRYNTVADEIKKRVHSLELFSEGVRRFIIGLSKKVLIANPMGELADTLFAMNPGDMSSGTAWLGILAYTLQIYFDFSGYSDMAIGLGKMFGFNFLENFNFPYISRSIAEFWRRWHISLGSWFRDYVYIPLGGNRKGPWTTYRNLLIVWTITGFWHGASWTFMAWGFYYGVIISLERLGLSKILEKLWRPLQHVYVLLIVMIGWVFFRSDSFDYSFNYIQTLFGFNGTQALDNATFLYMNDYGYVFVLGVIFSMPVMDWLKKLLYRENSFMGRYAVPIASPVVYMGLLLLVTMFLVNSTYNPFIYFRF